MGTGLRWGCRPTESRFPTTSRRLEFLVAALRSTLAWSRPLTAMGVLSLILGAVCLAAVALLGVEVAPEGNLVETGTFNGSVGSLA